MLVSAWSYDLMTLFQVSPMFSRCSVEEENL